MEVIKKTPEINDVLGDDEELQKIITLALIGKRSFGIAHDLRNVLTVFSSMIDMLKNKLPKDEETKNDIKMLKNSMETFKQLTDLMLDQKNHLNANPRQEIINAITQIISFIKFLAPKQVKINHSIDLQKEKLKLEIAPVHIKQIILNLCLNAIQALPEEGGRVEIKVNLTPSAANLNQPLIQKYFGKHIVIIVSDTGPGMDKTIINNVTHPFITSKKSEANHGLGLNIVHELATYYKGKVSILSKENAGTNICVYLPIEVSSSDEEKIETQGSSPDLGQKHISCV